MSTGPPPGSTLAVNPGSAQPASITIPATTAAIVLDSVFARLASAATAAQGISILLNSQDGTFTNYNLGSLNTAIGSTALVVDSFTLSDLGLMCGPNSSMTIAGGATPGASAGLTIVVQYHYT